MFEYYQNTLCVHGGWLYGEGDVMSMDSYKKMTVRNTLQVLRRGCKGNPALVAYESLPTKYKRIIEERIGGHPKTQTKRELLNEAITYDADAALYFADYRFDVEKAIPDTRQRQYVANASVLNAIGHMATNMYAKRMALGGKKAGIWEQMAANVTTIDKQAWPHTLPNNARRLKGRYKTYKEQGYESLIHKNYCNSNSEKIATSAGKYILALWSNEVQRIPNLEALRLAYNERAAKEKSWKLIKNEETLRNWLNHGDRKHLWYGKRYGDAASKEKFVYQHSTIMPTLRDSLWYADGTKLNFYYRTTDKDGKLQLATCQVYEVMDAYSETLLGYHVSKTENYEAQFMAFKMAIQTAGHRPYELRVDNQGGHKKLKTGDFLHKITHLAISTKPYNGKSKTIESAFGRFQQQIMKQHWFFTGQNVKAKRVESQPNKEFIAKQRTEDFPTLEEAIATYEQCRQAWNSAAHHQTGLPRLDMYQTSSNPKAKKIDQWDMVDIFWVLREKPVQLTAYGLTIKEANQKYTYMAYTKGKDGFKKPDVRWLRRHVDARFWVRFDPSDMSMIYIYRRDTNGDLRLVRELEQKITTSRAIQDQEAWEAAYIRSIEQDNEAARIEAFDEVQAIMEAHGMSAEQQGLRTPTPLGISKNKLSIGEVMKQESNADELLRTHQEGDELVPVTVLSEEDEQGFFGMV